MATNPSQQYFDDRMQLLGITNEINTIKIDKSIETVNGEKNIIYDNEQIFRCVPKGIEILVYSIFRKKTFYKPTPSSTPKPYTLTRLQFPFIKKNGDEMKYEIPKGQNVLPFFPPQLVQKFEDETPIETLVLTEGYFKAFKAAMCGIDCVGVPSITCLRDKETGELFAEIALLIKRCKVQRLVWLTDGDCRDITSKEIKDTTDLYTRPHKFFKSIQTFYDLTSKIDVLRYFAHVYTENLKDKPKGLDDLLIAYNTETQSITSELTTFNKKQDTGNYFVKFDITFGVLQIHRYMYLHDVDAFYLYHSEQRETLKNTEFKFNGTLYCYDEKENKCVIRIPKNAANYFRVADGYYKNVEIPDKWNNLTLTYHKRQKATILDDHGKDIFKHVAKYEAFCNVPDHINYQRVINNCFNTYHPFAHEPEDGNYSQTLDFLKHIFGEDEMKIDENTTIKRYEIALDYLTILYKTPQQILPILCLVSKERQTGKTTFLKWLKLIFTENCAIVGNQDFENNFNSHWATKLIIGCDETKIDKVVVMERIKGLSTASSIMKEGKGVDQIAMDFFGKFILLSNNEENFATIDREEIRFWVIKVPRFTTQNVDLLDDLLDEIPAFLHYLNQRKIITQRKERHWFDTKLLRTDALDKIVSNSKPTLEKNICHNLTHLFEQTGVDTICMSLDDVTKYIAKENDKGKNYVRNTLNNMGYKTNDAKRNLYFPIIEECRVMDRIDYKIIDKKCVGRYYEFARIDFATNTLTGEEEPIDDMPF